MKQFRVIFRSIKKHSQFIEKKCRVSGSQLWALALVAETPGIRVTELAGKLSVHQSTTSNLIDQLAQKKLLRRERAASDNRVVKLYVTEAGEDVVRQAPQPLRGLLLDALEQLPAETLVHLNGSLGDLLQAMKSRDESAGGIPLTDI